MKLPKKITNGMLLIVIGVMHSQFALSSECFGNQFKAFAKVYFYNVHRGLDDLPFTPAHTNLEAFSAFWFFYFGIIIIPLGLLVHSYERKNTFLPPTFTISYLLFVLIGCYMIPHSGMTFFMLPQAIYMLVTNWVKYGKSKKNIEPTSILPDIHVCN